MPETARSEDGFNRYRAAQMLELAEWAAGAYARLSRAKVLAIAEAAANAGEASAESLAQRACSETGFGVAEHKIIKNRLCSRGIFDYYKDEDFVSHRVDAETKMVEVPKPAGVVFALTPSTNPVATIFFKILLCLLTRNAVVIGAHPKAIDCCTQATRIMAEAAEAAGAPRGLIQIVPEPNLEVINFIMQSPSVDVILATGGTPMVRAAYSSGNPALGVGPGNAPAYVDRSADLKRAAKCLADSKAFDNSILCTNESAIIAHEDIVEDLKRALRSEGCYVCSEAERDKLEECLFPVGKFNVALLGKSAREIAKAGGIDVPHNTRVLVVPLERVGDDYALSGEKLCPVLGLLPVHNYETALNASRTMLRRTGGGHSAAIHARDAAVILRYGAALNVLRIAVNSPCSTGAAGFDTNLAPTMTVGTGFFGRSAVAENLRPHHLVNWTRVAFDKDPAVEFPSFEGLSLDPAPRLHGGDAPQLDIDPKAAELREEIRQIILEELRAAISGLKV
jgi:acyl-CoA reductase-like NAD-dependent aldehyde dehydrogenase